MTNELLEFDRFHTEELPRRLAAGNGALARNLAARLGPLTLQLDDGRSFTYAAHDTGIEIHKGALPESTRIEFDHECWLNLVRDLESGPGLLYSQRGQMKNGKGSDFLEWESGWRALYHGRPIFDPPDRAAEGLMDRSGRPLDLAQKFSLDCDLGEMAHFMKTTGFAVIEQVFSEAEIGKFWQASEALKSQAQEGDQSSWWGKSSSGETVLTRVLDGSVHEDLKNLEREERLTRFIEAVEPDLVPNLEGRDFISVLYKNRAMTEGLSDLPWHRDCGMGGHATMCPTINLSIFLSETNDETGPLRFLAGSHLGSIPFMDATAKDAPKGTSLQARPGDISLHYGDVMHAAPPPTGAGELRRSLVLTWKPAHAQPHTGEGHYNDVLLEGSEDGQVANLQQVLTRN